MKIAVVGCGAVGSYYGAQLCRIGQQVHFLVRSGLKQLRHSGVEIRSPAGNFKAYPQCYSHPDDIGESEVIIIGLKTTANHLFAELVAPLVGPASAIISLQNGLGNDVQLAALFGPDKILCGLCFVCLNREAYGLINHSAYGRIVLGEYQRPSSQRTQSLAMLFQQAGVPCEITDNLAGAQWAKLIWNIPFNGLGVAGSTGFDAVIQGVISPGIALGPCLTTDQLLNRPQWEQLVRELMGEVIRTAQTLGLPLDEHHMAINIERTRSMGAYKASTLLDFERGLPLELESMFGEPLRWAEKLGVAAPRLANMYKVLKQLALRTAPPR